MVNELPLMNYVVLKEGIPTRLHFDDHTVERITITDRQTGSPTGRTTLIFDVDRVNGHPVAAKYPIMADTHKGQLEAYLEGKVYRGYEFIITKTGRERLTKWTVERIPLK